MFCTNQWLRSRTTSHPENDRGEVYIMGIRWLSGRDLHTIRSVAAIFWGGAPEFYWSTFITYKLYVWVPQLKPIDWRPCRVIWSNGEGLGLATEMHEIPPSRLWECAQANYKWLIPNLQFTYCIMYKLHEWNKKALWQRFRLEICTKQVVGARACAYQILQLSSGINLAKNCAGK